MLRHPLCRPGVLLADVPILFTSAAHTDEALHRVIQAFEAIFNELA
jgi:glutamate-1-semialdehyde aminotransferase